MKSVLSVITGYAVMVLITMVLFAVLAAVAPDQFGLDAEAVPGDVSLVVILTVGLGAALSGGWVTGRLAPRRPGRHVAALVVVVLLMGVVSLAMDGDAVRRHRSEGRGLGRGGGGEPRHEEGQPQGTPKVSDHSHGALSVRGMRAGARSASV